MLFEETDTRFKSKLEINELDELLDGSRLFPSKSGQPVTYQAQEAEEVMKKYCTLYQIAQADGEHKLKVPPLQKKRQRKTETDAGKDWYHMKAPDMTPELKEDLQAIMLRRHLDPKRFYKKDDLKDPPKFFQIGTLVNAPDDPVSYRVDKYKRKKSLVEQLLEEDQKINFSKKKWEQVMKSKPKKKNSSKSSKSHKKRKLGFK
jgi:Fcf2 pre-rRNA processing